MKLINADKVIETLKTRKKLFCRNQIEFRMLSPDQKSRVDEIDTCLAELVNAEEVQTTDTDSDTISRQAAIDALGDMPEGDDDFDTGCRQQWNWDTEAIKALPPAQHWNPVTENTLPDKNRVVVVCGEKGTWDYGTYRGHADNIHFWHWKKNTYKRVYWWMYKEDALPDPTRG